MALTAEQEKSVVKAAQVASTLLEMLGDMTVVNELWNGAPDWDTLITNEELGEIPAFADAGLTHTALADGIYQIAVIRNQVMTGNLPALALLAQFK